MKTKSSKQKKQTKPAVQLKDIQPKKAAKGGGRRQSDGFDDIIVGAGPGAPGGHVKL